MSSKPYAYGYIPYSDMGDCLDWDDVEKLPPTERSPITQAKLTIVDKYEPMFLSATWTPVVMIDDVIVFRADHHTLDRAHTVSFMKVWARTYIRNEKDVLKNRGVDVNRAYAEWGGDVRDL